jgi:hypothetical protein
MCFAGDEDCADWMSRTALRAPRFKRSELVLQSTLSGWPGATRRVIFLIVPPSNEETATSSLADGNADDSGAGRSAGTRSDE